MATDDRNTGTRTMTRRPNEAPGLRAGGGVLSPFALLREMTDWMDQTFEGGDSPITRGERLWAPAVEVREKDNSLVVYADLPGINENEVKVEVDNNMLVIQGERKREQTDEREGVHRSERFYGTFYRAIALPENAKPENAKAEFKNGVLEVKVPLEQQQSHRKQIPIGGQSQISQGTSQGSSQTSAQGSSQTSSQGSSQTSSQGSPQTSSQGSSQRNK